MTIDESQLAELVKNTFMPDRNMLNINLHNIETRLLNERRYSRRAILNTYKHIAFSDQDTGSYREDRNVVKYLELLGIIQKDKKGRPFVSNKIYAEAFNLNWIIENTPVAQPKRILIKLINLFKQITVLT